MEPNLDAAPAATADADSARTDKAAPRPGDGTGDTPTLTDAEREAVWFAIAYAQNAQHTSETTLRGLLERLGAANSGDDRRSVGGEHAGSAAAQPSAASAGSLAYRMGKATRNGGLRI